MEYKQNLWLRYLQKETQTVDFVRFWKVQHEKLTYFSVTDMAVTQFVLELVT